MKPQNDIHKLVKKLHLKASADLDRRVYHDFEMALAEYQKTESAVAQPNIGRIIMKSKITKFAIAAVIIIACLVGLSLWRNTGSGILLADVLARIEKVKAVRCKLYIKVTSEDPNNPYNFESRETLLESREYGIKDIGEYSDLNSGETKFQESYILPQKKTRISIIPKDKRYLRIELDDISLKQLQETAGQNNDPLFYLKEILKDKYESLGRSTIDGIEVAGFRSEDPNLSSGVTTLWVDIKTLLPMRFEQTFYKMKYYIHIVVDNFQWDVPVDASDFDPPVPDGYTVRLVKFPPHITEEIAIQGLKVWVDLLGKYPDPKNISNQNDVAPMVLRLAQASETPTALRLKEDTKGLAVDEVSNKLVDFLIPIRGLTRFYNLLQWDEKKDLAYYGNTITPEDADKVLMRWKVSDSEYRVIYGDLHVETVTNEKLTELEKDLPK